MSNAPSFQVIEKEGEFFVKKSYKNRFFGIKKGKTPTIPLRDAVVVGKYYPIYGWLFDVGSVTIKLPATEEHEVIPNVKNPREFLQEMNRDMTPVEEIRRDVVRLIRKTFWISLIVISLTFSLLFHFYERHDISIYIMSVMIGIVLLAIVAKHVRSKRKAKKISGKGNQEKREPARTPEKSTDRRERRQTLRGKLEKRRSNKKE